MAAPRRLPALNDCLNCTLRKNGDFCQLPDTLLREFNAMGHLTLYPGNATLLREGQIPRGIYVVCSGRAKLAVEARDGKTLILKIAGNREVLGLSAIVSGRPSPMTVTTIEFCQIKFIEQESFMRLLEGSNHITIASPPCWRGR